jgi:hypothetical protein
MLIGSVAVVLHRGFPVGGADSGEAFVNERDPRTGWIGAREITAVRCGLLPMTAAIPVDGVVMPPAHGRGNEKRAPIAPSMPTGSMSIPPT